jgi:hypothetical protein
LWAECERIGRDPADIMTSTHLLANPDDPSVAVAQAESYAEAGLDMGIVYLPPPHTPASLEAHAVALQHLAD